MTGSPPGPPPPSAKMPKHKVQFTFQLSNRFKSFKAGRNPYEAECLICPPGTYVSVAHKGATDLETHIRSQKHMRSVKVASGSQDLAKLFGQSSHQSNAVSLAEATLSYFLVNHHVAYRAMDCAPKMLCKNFPDSEILRSVKCARTKAEAIVNKVLAPHSVEMALERLGQISCFGVSTDGSNHGDLKIFPVVIQFFDHRHGGLQAKLLEFQSTPDETSETISSLLIETLTRFGIAGKCVAFGGDNTNTNFGGLGRGEGNNILTKLKHSFSKPLVGVGCPAHILHNCIQHGAFRMELNVTNIVNDIYHYFSIYAVRTKQLEEYCKFVEIEYKRLRSTTKTRWLTMFPAIERLLEMFEALKAFFLSVSRPPRSVYNFFTSCVSKAYLWHMHSLMAVFHDNLERIQREKNSVIDVKAILENVCSLLEYRLECSFISANTEEQLERAREEGFRKEADLFMDDAMSLYSECLDYFKKWSVSFEDYSCFSWMELREKVMVKNVKESITFLRERGVVIDDSKFCDQLCNLNLFLNKHHEELATLSANDRWVKYFETTQHKECHSELLKVAEFFFALPAHNATLERIFSLMGAQWTPERNLLSVESVKGLMCVKFNFKEFTCCEFHDYLSGKPDLLKLVASSEKYD